MAGLSPRRKAGSIRGGRAERLTAAIREVLTRAIDDGGTSLRDRCSRAARLAILCSVFPSTGVTANPVMSAPAPSAASPSPAAAFYCPACQRRR